MRGRLGAEGRVEGKAESIIELLEELGPVPEELRKKIMKERARRL